MKRSHDSSGVADSPEALDAQGRTEKTAGGLTRVYVYDAEDIAEERINGSSPDTIRYYHGAGIDEPLARKNSADVVTHHLADHLGSIVQETNARAQSFSSESTVPEETPERQLHGRICLPRPRVGC